METMALRVSGPKGLQEIPLNPKGVVLGRDAHCDVTLDNDSVSRKHARISQDPFGRWIVEDMHSSNGVLVEGKAITAQAIQAGQTITIRPFELSLVKKSGSNASEMANIPVVDKGIDEQIVAFREDRTEFLSPALMRKLNDLTDRLLNLASPAELYHEATQSIAQTLNTLVAVLRLPSEGALQTSPDVLALSLGGQAMNTDQLKSMYVHFSKRVLEAARATASPVMGGSTSKVQSEIQLTIVDEHKPHRVYAARVNQVGDGVDILYVDIQEDKTPEHMFDFVEALARQLNFAQKNLLFVELEKKEKSLREANEQLKAKDRIKDEYVSRVTHDIKGHLGAIQSCLFIAGDTSSHPLSELQEDFMNRATSRTKQLLDFVIELLNLTRMRLKGQLEKQDFDLAETLLKSVEAVRTKADDKSIQLTSSIDPAVQTLYGNEFSISEMVTNLLFNAVKYTPEGKSVHLAAQNIGGGVQIDIVDTGIGIPAEDLDHVFDEFFRASNAQSSTIEGTGLGLSIVKQIVEQHGGKVSVTSISGKGSTFTVFFPMNK